MKMCKEWFLFCEKSLTSLQIIKKYDKGAIAGVSCECQQYSQLDVLNLASYNDLSFFLPSNINQPPNFPSSDIYISNENLRVFINVWSTKHSIQKKRKKT